MTTATLTTPDPYAVFDALVTHLATVTGRPIGEAIKPPGNPHTIAPYASVFPITESDIFGTLADWQSGTTFNYQVTSVGVSADMALDMSSDVRAALTKTNLDANPIDLSAAGLDLVSIGKTGGNAIERDDAVQPPLFYIIDDLALVVIAS